MLHPVEYKTSHAAITIAHIGKALECSTQVFINRSVYTLQDGLWWSSEGDNGITTDELVNKYFESIK